MLKYYPEILTLFKNTAYSMLNNEIIPVYRVVNSKIWRINMGNTAQWIYNKKYDIIKI